MTAGPDANVWVTLYSTLLPQSQLLKLAPDGTMTLYTLPQATAWPYGITRGPDGNLWFTEVNGNRIGKITPSGMTTEYQIPTANSMPRGITTGPDHNLWFVESAGNKIAKLAINPTPAAVPVLPRAAMLFLCAVLLSCGLIQLYRKHG